MTESNPKTMSKPQSLPIKQLEPTEVRQRLAERPETRLLDVREEWEYQTARIDGAILVTEETAKEILESWDRNTPIICCCHHGFRSQQACAFLAGQGFTNLANLAGGIDAWSCQVDPTVPRY